MSLAEATSLRLSKRSNGLELSAEEFDAITKWDPRYSYELVHGVVIVSPIPAEGEAAPVDELGYLLMKYQREHPRGSVLDWTLPERYIPLSDETRRKADRVIWLGLDHTPDPRHDVPAIAIEFVSKSKRDRQRDYETKRREYREVGVLEYGIVDRFRRTMTVSLADGSCRVVAENEVYTTPLMPGFRTAVAIVARCRRPVEAMMGPLHSKPATNDVHQTERNV